MAEDRIEGSVQDIVNDIAEEQQVKDEVVKIRKGSHVEDLDKGYLINLRSLQTAKKNMNVRESRQ